MSASAASTRRCLAAALSIAAGAAAINLGEPALAQPAPYAIDVKVEGPSSPALVEAIARLGEPTRHVIAPGRGFLDIVSARCGPVDLVYVTAFLRENQTVSAADLSSLQVGTEYSFPACARSPAATAHRIRPNEMIGVLYRDMGLSVDDLELRMSPEHLKSFNYSCLGRLGVNGAAPRDRNCSRAELLERERTRQFLLANPRVDARQLQIDQQVLLPREPISSTIVLRDGVALEAAEAEFQAALGAAGTARQARIASLVADTPLPPGSCAGTAAVPPLAFSELREALEKNERARHRDHRRPDRVSVMILDTGLDERMLGRPIPSDRLWRMRPLSGGPQIHSGINLATHEPDATPPPGLPNRLHGSEVAALVLGGRYLEDHRVSLGRIVVAFASIADETSEGAFLSSSAIANAFSLARLNEIDIINASVSALAERNSFGEALNRSNGAVLFIAAAGNDGGQFSLTDQSWPGSFGGAPQNAERGLLVTVGSHDPSGGMSAFSRRGGGRVDLLAAGCSISTYTLGEGPDPAAVDRSGTSYAAPLVSLVASLARLEGVPLPEVKNRLIASADVDGALDNLVWSRGKLNIRKALSIWEDFVHYEVEVATGRFEERILYGKLMSLQHKLEICDAFVLHPRIIKLSRARNSARPNDPARFYVWERSSDLERPQNIERHARCETASGPALVFHDSATGRRVDIPPGRIIDFVARSM